MSSVNSDGEVKKPTKIDAGMGKIVKSPYIIVSGDPGYNACEELSKKVNRRIQDGYIPIGGGWSCNDSSVFYQAMVLKKMVK